MEDMMFNLQGDVAVVNGAILPVDGGYMAV